MSVRRRRRDSEYGMVARAVLAGALADRLARAVQRPGTMEDRHALAHRNAHSYRLIRRGGDPPCRVKACSGQSGCVSSSPLPCGITEDRQQGLNVRSGEAAYDTSSCRSFRGPEFSVRSEPGVRSEALIRRRTQRARRRAGHGAAC